MIDNTPNAPMVLGTRGSMLARTQTESVAELLRALDIDVTVRIFETRGDRDQSAPVPELGGKGLFTAELEAALLAGDIDAAVHSLKDLPTDDTPGLKVGAVLRREDPRDALVTRGSKKLADLPTGARVGTASRRRAALLLAVRPDLVVVPVRGNIDTRVGRVEGGDLDGVVLAAAGLKRIARTDAISELLSFLPAPAQGALAVQARTDRGDVLENLSRLHDPATFACTSAERALLHSLEGGCSVPVGALAEPVGAELWLRGLVASLDGKRVLEAEARHDDPWILGEQVAAKLREQGAQEILDALS